MANYLGIPVYDLVWSAVAGFMVLSVVVGISALAVVLVRCHQRSRLELVARQAHRPEDWNETPR